MKFVIILELLYFHIIRVGDSAVRGTSTIFYYKFLTILLPRRLGFSVLFSFSFSIDRISSGIEAYDSFLSLRNFMIPLGLAESPCVEFRPMPLKLV